MARMSVEEVWGLITFCGDALIPAPGQNDLRVLTVQAVHRLPRRVQDWLLSETAHVFIAGHGQPGEFIELGFPPKEVEDGLVKVRVIFLSERLMDVPAEAALWTVAREVGNSWLDARGGGESQAAGVDRLVTRWGFSDPRGSAAGRKRPAPARNRRPAPRAASRPPRAAKRKGGAR